MKNLFCKLIRSDIEKIVAEANFTPEQKAIFDELCRGELTDLGIALKLNMSESALYARKKVILEKIARILHG